jgi:hypothetical protein
MNQLINQSGLVTSVQPSNLAAIDVSAADAVFTQPRLLYIGTTGDVKVDGASLGTGVTFSNVPVGWFPVLVKKVYTATTASNIVSLY